ncbi:MAG: endonuclease/exonuclease/phosphatase family protein [Muribaculaceae bacterium]|nr:endonuclease/exonuclease/phosphatase family protein [Muribaculaceae bacterium]
MSDDIRNVDLPDSEPQTSDTDAEIIARATGQRRGRSNAPKSNPKSGASRKASRKRFKKQVKSTVSGWRKAGRIFLWLLMAVVSAGMFISGFSGHIAPASVKWVAFPPMTFPGWLIALILLTVLSAFTYRKPLLLALVTWIGCLHPILEYSPLNFSTPSPKDYPASQRFTFLTYNVANLNDLTGNYDGDVNTTLSYIMRTNADIVSLQEAVSPAVSGPKHITPEQVDSLHALYPYIIMYGRSQMIMSKFPVTVVHTGEAEMAAALRSKSAGSDDLVKPTAEIAVFRVDVRGTPITVFDLHLQSYNLSGDDKSLYREITDIKDAEKVKELKSTISQVRKSLLTKVHEAAVLRQADTERLEQLIAHYGGPNIIVAGDFNDVPGSYVINRLENIGFRQVYTEVGFGPMITFNANRFYFRIDHVLYRGALRPLRMVRGGSRASDHYPLLTTFAISKQDK